MHKQGITKESAKWRACVLTCFACFTGLACSHAFPALMLSVIACLACFTCLRAWSAPWNSVLGVFHKIGVLGVLHKVACLACFIKWRAWRAWRVSLNGVLKIVKFLS